LPIWVLSILSCLAVATVLIQQQCPYQQRNDSHLVADAGRIEFSGTIKRTQPPYTSVIVAIVPTMGVTDNNGYYHLSVPRMAASYTGVVYDSANNLADVSTTNVHVIGDHGTFDYDFAKDFHAPMSPDKHLAADLMRNHVP